MSLICDRCEIRPPEYAEKGKKGEVKSLLCSTCMKKVKRTYGNKIEFVKMRNPRHGRIAGRKRSVRSYGRAGVGSALAATKEALARYRRFHGTDPEKITRVRFDVPRRLVRVGKAHSFSYVPSRPSRKQSRTGRPFLYTHKFGAGVQGYTNEKGTLLIVMGGNFRVTDWLRG